MKSCDKLPFVAALIICFLGVAAPVESEAQVMVQIDNSSSTVVQVTLVYQAPSSPVLVPGQSWAISLGPILPTVVALDLGHCVIVEIPAPGTCVDTGLASPSKLCSSAQNRFVFFD